MPLGLLVILPSKLHMKYGESRHLKLITEKTPNHIRLTKHCIFRPKMKNTRRASCRYICSKLLRNMSSHISDDTTYSRFKVWLQVMTVANRKNKKDTYDFLTTSDHLSEYGG